MPTGRVRRAPSIAFGGRQAPFAIGSKIPGHPCGTPAFHPIWSDRTDRQQETRRGHPRVEREGQAGSRGFPP
jgi:hypothetical protein